jgi:DNA-binding IclR family transcriptional regulator
MAIKLDSNNIELQMGLENVSGENAQKDRQFVTALARGLEILRCFKSGEPLLGNQEIAEKTGLPKPTVSRLAYTLTLLGYLKYSKSLRKYQLGTSILSFGYGLLTNMEILQIARPFFQELADYAQAAVGLCAQDRLSMVYLENIYPNTNAVVLKHRIGELIPLATTSAGRAYLCAIDEKDRKYLLDQIRLRNEISWPEIKQGIDQAFKDYENHGYCLSLGDYSKGVHAIAVPVRTPAVASNIMTISCGAAAFQLSPDIIESDIGPRLVHMSSQIQSQICQS